MFNSSFYFNPRGRDKYCQVVTMNSINHLALSPDCLEELEILSSFVQAPFSSFSKIRSDAQKQKELTEDERYQRETDRQKCFTSILDYLN